jgi:hypothetical protein
MPAVEREKNLRRSVRASREVVDLVGRGGKKVFRELSFESVQVRFLLGRAVCCPGQIEKLVGDKALPKRQNDRFAADADGEDEVLAEPAQIGTQQCAVDGEAVVTDRPGDRLEPVAGARPAKRVLITTERRNGGASGDSTENARWRTLKAVATPAGEPPPW